MAIFHLTAQVIKRSEGRSVVAAAAYRAAERLVDERLGVVHNFTRKGGVEHREILVPDNAPAWALDRERLWNEVERSEKRIDAQLARELRLALPKELDAQQQVELVRGYLRDHFVSAGMIADLAIHRDNADNPHAHILLTMREVGPEGFGKKARDWNRVEALESWREQWALCCNQSLARCGLRSRVTHLSHAARGLFTLPGIKIGIERIKTALERRGFIRERLTRQQVRRFRNGEVIRQNPRAALQELTYHEATFTRAALETYLKTHTASPEQFAACVEAVMGAPEVVFAGLNERRAEVFTTRETLEGEQAMLATARELCRVREPDSGFAAERLARFGENLGLSAEQTAALVHVVKETGGLAVVEGFAGTGKSRMFDGARFVWEKESRRVLGAALAGKAAEELGRSASLNDSRSLAAWEFAWKEGRDRLRKGDVLIIDEAGMVGTRQMGRVLEAAKAAGAKVVLAGDTEQLQAVEAGSPFHAIGELVESKATLSMIRRQREDWQREASQDLARGRTAQAVAAYRQRGHIHDRFDNEAAAVAAIMKAWEANERADKNVAQVALSYRRAHIPELNLALRSVRQAMGVVRGDCLVQTEDGPKAFGEGDRLCFTRNTKALYVRNGTLGTVTGVSATEVSVRLDGPDGRTVSFKNGAFTHVDYGYAMSVHKSQGITVDRVHVLASRAFDRRAAYVAMTRHRDRLDVYASAQEFGKADLGQMFARTRHKRLALDYMADYLMTQRLEAGRGDRGRSTQEPQAQADQPRAPSGPEGPGKVVVSSAMATGVEQDARRSSSADRAVLAHDERKHPARPHASRDSLDAVGHELAVAQALARAENAAKGPRTSLADALNTIPETQEARQALLQATDARAFWRAAVARREEARKSLAERLGLRRQAQERDPVSGQLMTAEEGLTAAERRVKLAAERFERLCEAPDVRAAARRFAEAKNRTLDEAKARVATLRAEYGQAKAASRLASQREAARGRERETPDLER